MRDTDEFHEWQNSRDGFWTNFKRKISPIAVVGFIGLVMFGWYLSQQKGMNSNVIYVITGVILLVIIFKTDRGREEEPIPDNVIKLIASNLMKRKIGTEFPIGTQINPTGYCKMRFEGEWGQPFRPWKWEVGFEIIYSSGLKETRLLILHPFKGYITGIVKKPAGYNGEDSTDLKVLMPLQLTVKDEGAKKP